MRRLYLGNECQNGTCHNKAQENGKCRACNRIAQRSPAAIQYVRTYQRLSIPRAVLKPFAPAP